jgi:gp16 family phage-associated protein
MPLKTRQQVREEFNRKGWSYTGWAKRHNYSAALVREILKDSDSNPQRKCLRGESHNIAVQLGIKEGEVSRASLASMATA